MCVPGCFEANARGSRHAPIGGPAQVLALV
jgi:hypothetical protein